MQVAIISTATTQSALLNHEVYLTEYFPPPVPVPCLELSDMGA